MKIEIPEGAKNIIAFLNNYGAKAYIVGGCVRDSLLGKQPKDWDICTGATPSEVISLMASYGIRTIPTGLKHGTVTVVMNDGDYEVTTFRKDGEYKDGRHPEKVEFISDLKEDLMRRDFTINAMAYNEKDGLVDYFGGMEDLVNSTIRCVGNPYDRFEEDHLRMLRAIRFSAVYDFKIDPWTDFALRERFSKISSVSKERINSELCKILMSPHGVIYLENYKYEMAQIIPEFLPCIGFEQNNPYHVYDVYGHTMASLAHCSDKSLVVKLAVLLHDIGKPDCYSENETGGHFYGHAYKSAQKAKEILTRLRFDNETIGQVVKLIEYHDRVLNEDKKSIKRLINKLGIKQTINFFDVREADIFGHSVDVREKSLTKLRNCRGIFSKIICENECTKIKDLDINGKDIMDLGVPEGKIVGEVLNYLLQLVLDDKCENSNSKLILKAKEYLSEINRKEDNN